jgi:D-alanyl-D-alanine carboxypeptidase (penicillin-binding protein 5/6)
VINDTPVNLILSDEIIYTREIGVPPLRYITACTADCFGLTEIMEDQVITSVQILEEGMVLNSFALTADSSVIPSQKPSKNSLIGRLLS